LEPKPIGNELADRIEAFIKDGNNVEAYPGEYADLEKVLCAYLDNWGFDRNEKCMLVIDNALKSRELRLLKAACVYLWEIPGDHPDYDQLLPE
jgi:hypothetical protein